MEIIAQYSTLFLILAIVFGLYMTWGIGANDVANAMGTSVGSGAVTVKQAIIIAAIMEFAGAYLAGGGVASTISKGIVDTTVFEAQPRAAGLRHARRPAGGGHLADGGVAQGWPVSTTHSIVGAVVGFAIAGRRHERGALGQDGRDRRQLVRLPGARRPHRPAADAQHPQADPEYRRPDRLRPGNGAPSTRSWWAGWSPWSPCSRASSTSTST